MLESLGKIWDHAAAVILVREAGGAFQDRAGGQRLDLGSSRYTNRHIDGALDRFLAG